MAAVPAEVHGPSDAELIDSVRGGRVDAYGALYERHIGAAHNLARQLARSRAEADDLVSEAFARVLDTLRAGRGPDSAFRAYLLTSLRHVAYDKTRRDRRLELTEDVTTVSGVDTEKVSQPFRDTVVAGLDRSLAAKAFARLPERWQAVLWHTEIEEQSPAEVAPLLGLTPNGVSALAYRAREGLRQAYLQVHLAETNSGRCQATADKLGAWTRGGLSKRETTQVETHLDECDRCRALAAELADVNGGLRVVAILVLGVGATGYLAVTAKTAAVAVAGAGAAAGAAGTAAAGSASGSGGAAAGAAGSLPRQFVGVGASVAALAVALAIALTGSHAQTIPAAAPAPPAPAAPAPKPKPPAPAPAPAPPANPAVPPPAPPANPPVNPPAPAPNPPAPAPGAPMLTASGPSTPITLVPGQGPVDVPITARNTGSAPSQPVAATLNLPPGVSALPAGQFTPHSRPAGRVTSQSPGTTQGPGATQGAGAAPSAWFGPGPSVVPATAPLSATQSTTQSATGSAILADAPLRAGSVPPAPQVDCPGGTGTLTCTSPTGLQPGQSVVLLFRLVASPTATGGRITGTVTSGTTISLSISITVTVTPPPAVDAVTLAVSVDQDYSWWDLLWNDMTLLDVTATNTGASTKPIQVTEDRPGSAWASTPDVRCTGEDGPGDGGLVVCVTERSLAPGQSVHLRVRVYHLHPGRDSVTVSAALGAATAARTVQVTPVCFLVCVGPDGSLAGTPAPTTGPTDPTAPPTTTTTAPTTGPTTTTGPSDTTPAPVVGTTGPTPPTLPAPRPTAPSPQPPQPPATTTPTDPSCPSTGGKLRPGGGLGLCLPLLGPL